MLHRAAAFTGRVGWGLCHAIAKHIAHGADLHTRTAAERYAAASVGYVRCVVVCACVCVRVGPSPLPPTLKGLISIYSCLCDSYYGEMAVGPALRRCLQFHLELRRFNPLRTVDVVLNTRRRVTLYTDASAEDGVVSLCYVLLLDSGQGVGGTAIVPPEVLQSFMDEQTFIAHGEALAPWLALWHEGQHLRGASVVVFIDNLGVLAALCN